MGVPVDGDADLRLGVVLPPGEVAGALHRLALDEAVVNGGRLLVLLAVCKGHLVMDALADLDPGGSAPIDLIGYDGLHPGAAAASRALKLLMQVCFDPTNFCKAYNAEPDAGGSVGGRTQGYTTSMSGSARLKLSM